MNIKKIALLLITIAMTLSLCACGNKTLLDTTYTFDEAIIRLPDGSVISGEVTTWTDYEDGDSLQITLKDGNTYLVHASNAVLISKENIEKIPKILRKTIDKVSVL